MQNASSILGFPNIGSIAENRRPSEPKRRTSPARREPEAVGGTAFLVTLMAGVENVILGFRMPG
jgi:hypothetical protein